MTGNVLVAWRLDRIGYDLLQVIDTVHDLLERGIGVRVLAGDGTQIDTTTEEGRDALRMVETLAEIDRVMQLASARPRVVVELNPLETPQPIEVPGIRILAPGWGPARRKRWSGRCRVARWLISQSPRAGVASRPDTSGTGSASRTVASTADTTSGE